MKDQGGIPSLPQETNVNRLNLSFGSSIGKPMAKSKLKQVKLNDHTSKNYIFFCRIYHTHITVGTLKTINNIICAGRRDLPG